MPVKAGTPAGMLAARISTCGPPRAALITVEPSGFGRGVAPECKNPCIVAKKPDLREKPLSN